MKKNIALLLITFIILFVFRKAFLSENPSEYLREKVNTFFSNDNSYNSQNVKNRDDSQTMNESWEPFLEEFRTSLVNKDKAKILSMTDANNFFDGGGGATINEFLNDADHNTELGWNNLTNSLKYRIDGTNEKQTVGGYPSLYFKYKNGRWYWMGIVGD